MKLEDFPFLQLESTLEKVGPTELNVLISGEPGTFKERIAQRIFERSAGKRGRLERIDPQSFRLDELPAEKGTTERIGAERRTTLYVARVQDLGDHQQRRLLQVAELESAAPDHPFPTNRCRIIAASDVDLMDQVRRGAFRNDLYFRLCEVEIRVPPLRKSREFIPELLDELLSQRGRSGNPITMRQYDLVRNYPWPGNLRELESFAERVARLSDPTKAFVDLQSRFGAVSQRSPSLPQVLTLTRKRAQQKAVGWALQQTQSDRTAAAKLLGISVQKLDGIEENPSTD